jgi:hypothetical protein
MRVFVEQTPAEQEGYPWSLIDGPERRRVAPGLFARKELGRKNAAGPGRARRAWSSQTMTISDLARLDVPTLVDRFVALALQQDRALLDDDIRKFNRIFDQMEAVKSELKARPGDQRSALLPLLDHPHVHVRLKAAKATLAVAPEVARNALQAIRESREYPQAGDAGMTLICLDRGIFKPT